MKRMGLIVGVLVLGGIGAGFVVLRAWPMINMVETGRTPEYPDVQPRTYQRPMGEVFDAAMHAVSRLSRWTLVGYDETHGEIRVEARSRLWRFVDDITIRVTDREGATVVDVRSASRVGRGDFGQNARNIRRFQDELETQIGSGAAH